MSKRLFKLGAACFLFVLCVTAISDAQNGSLREVQWQNYKLPATEFTRVIAPTKTLIFRVPVGWKRQGETLVFSGGDNTVLNVAITEIPEGIGLKNYVASILQGLHNIPGGIEGLSVRRAEMSGIEA